MKIDYMIDHKMNPDAEDEQRCSKCGVTKTIAHYSQNKKGDYFKRCDPCREKTCKNARMYRSKNKEENKKKAHVYYMANKERILAIHKTYKDTNKEQTKDMNKKYYVSHIDKIEAYRYVNRAKHKEYSKKYYAENKDVDKARCKVYQAVNKEKISIKRKVYNANNKDKRKAYYESNKDRHKCDECGYSSYSPSDLRKHACGNDGMSSGEREVFRVLNDLRIDFDFGGRTVYLPIKEATGRGLKYDFIVRFEDRLLFIEYDGRQHFKAIPHWGGENSLDGVRERDAIKTKFCEDRGYPLLRIPYTKHGMIPSLVVEFMVEYTNWGYE
jgi:hypothetical protein